MHDIGNPPFGHAGEQAIRSWFKGKKKTDWFASLDPRHQSDFLHFNGNAQGFRVVTRLARGDRAGGLQLTASTLAAMLKYPWESGTEGREKNKFSAFQSELDQLRWVARETELPQVGATNCWGRHPLAFLVEAADDMAYTTRDLEDGLRLGLISYDEYRSILEPIAAQESEYKQQNAPPKGDHAKQRDAAAYLRTMAIGVLLEASAEAFLERWPSYFTGNPQDLLKSTKASEAVATAKKFARERCYQAKQVMYLELSGHNVIHRLLDLMELAVFKTTGVEASARGTKIRKLLDWKDQHAALTPYGRMQQALDVVSGMTDRYAVNFCKKCMG